MNTHSSKPFPQTERSRPQRVPRRVESERQPIYEIIDAAPICHVGFALDQQPFVIPTIHARQGDRLFFHGATQSRLIHAISSGNPICVTFTFLDGIVAARSAMHHSMNYRSVVAFGTGRQLDDPAEREEAFRLTVEKLLPGRWTECRQPNEAEAKVTAIAALDIAEATLKTRSGPPNDVESDYQGPHWAGVIPLRSGYGEPIPDPRLSEGATVPEHIRRLVADSR